MSFDKRTYEVFVDAHKQPPLSAQDLQLLLNFLGENTYIVEEMEDNDAEDG